MFAPTPLLTQLFDFPREGEIPEKSLVKALSSGLGMENICLFLLVAHRVPPGHTRYARGIRLIGIHDRDSAMTSTRRAAPRRRRRRLFSMRFCNALMFL